LRSKADVVSPELLNEPFDPKQHWDAVGFTLSKFDGPSKAGEDCNLLAIQSSAFQRRQEKSGRSSASALIYDYTGVGHMNPSIEIIGNAGAPHACT